MAMSDWSTTASSNGTSLGINIAENCPAANVNNALREIMAQTRATITTNTLAVSGNGSVGGAFSVTGNATFGGTLGITGALTLSAALSGTSASFTGNGIFGGTISVTGNGTIGGTIDVTGAASLHSTLAVTGAVTLGGTLYVPGIVKLNTSDATGQLNVAGLIQARGTGSTAAILLYNTTGAHDWRAGQSDTSYFYITDNTTATEWFNILADGTTNIRGTAVNLYGPLQWATLSNFIISPNSGTPKVQWDSGDYDSYDRSGNARGFYIGSALKLSLTASGLFDGSGNKYWNAANDGSGSGLDADLLDGYESTAFVRVTSSSIIENGGYRVYSDGLIETWGYIDIGQDSTGTYTLPVAHTSWVVPTISAYWPADQTSSAHAVDWTSNNGSPPSSISFRNADDRTVRVWVHTKGA